MGVSSIKEFNWILNKSNNENTRTTINFLNYDEAIKARNFHKKFKQYNVTPLINLQSLAEFLGVSGIYVKDESIRFGLNSFKILGGLYALGNCIAKRLGINIQDVDLDDLKAEKVKAKLGDITFAAATDGNHGRAVAWAANLLGYKAVIYMPKGSSLKRLNNIKKFGADTIITDLNYDKTVRLLVKTAEERGWFVIQDTAWEGYEEVPIYIMQGYTTMVLEVIEQIKLQNLGMPTHILVQAGVGALAGSVVGFFSTLFKDDKPVMVVLESNKADCFYKSAIAGKPKSVNGDMNTIMVGLACGEPNPIAWNILKDYSDMFVSVPDYVAARGMRILGNPLGNDSRVISGESGAVTLGFLSCVLQHRELIEIKEALKINKDSKILLFSTEGDTDPEIYRRIVWDGDYKSI